MTHGELDKQIERILKRNRLMIHRAQKGSE
jgi:hypothetical protein